MMEKVEKKRKKEKEDKEHGGMWEKERTSYQREQTPWNLWEKEHGERNKPRNTGTYIIEIRGNGTRPALFAKGKPCDEPVERCIRILAPRDTSKIGL